MRKFILQTKLLDQIAKLKFRQCDGAKKIISGSSSDFEGRNSGSYLNGISESESGTKSNFFTKTKEQFFGKHLEVLNNAAAVLFSLIF